ncbi:MAG: alpha/beta hydrolase, partial [Solirubrobacterales bacterium]|nr:alpha/beta hydrolase [Solirubrobacterales bacterium]
DLRDPDLSPVFAQDLTGAPPAFVLAASHDVLRDDALTYAERLRTAGVEVTLRDVAGHTHGYLRWAGAVDEAGASLAAMGAYAAAALVR